MTESFKDHKEIKGVIDSLSAKPGLYGMFGRPASGKTTAIMYFTHFLAEEGKKSLVLSLELAKESWIDRMRKLGLNTENVVVCDTPGCSMEKLVSLVASEKPDMVFIDYIQLFNWDLKTHSEGFGSVLPELKRMSESVPTLFAGNFAGLTNLNDWIGVTALMFSMSSCNDWLTVGYITEAAVGGELIDIMNKR